MQCIKWTCDTFATFETKQCLLSPPELCRPRELFFAHANVLEMQTRAGYGEVGIFINSTKRKPSWQALQPKGLVHQPIQQPALVYSRSSIEFMQRYYCSMFLPKFNVRLCIAVPHAAKSRNHVVRVCSLHCSTLLPTPPPSESLIRLHCSATCCVYSLAAPPAFILVRTPQSFFHFYMSPEDPLSARWREICIFMWLRILYCTRDVVEGYINKADCDATVCNKEWHTAISVDLITLQTRLLGHECI